MLRLPNELLPLMASELELERRVNALAQTNQRLFSCLGHILYRLNTELSDGSALRWAATHGREQTAKKSLESGASCISEAVVLTSESGHEGMVKILLAVYTPPGATNVQNYRHAFILAASMGRDSIVKLLLNSEKLKIDSKDAATEKGFEAILDKILDEWPG